MRLPILLLLSCFLAPSAPAQTPTGTEGQERPPQLVPLVPATEAALHCTLDALESLGWRLTRAAGGASPTVHGGTPCRRASLAEAQTQGDLRATLPADAAEAEAMARTLLQHPASHCAFSIQLGEATRRAVDALVANRGFRFSALQTGWIGFGLGGARRDGWRSVRSFGRGFVPATTPSAAITGFYRATVRAECGVGRQIAQYAALHELFGPDGFDAAFAPQEIVLGTFTTLQQSDSVLLGRGAGTLLRDGRGAAAAALGRQAFAGRPGFVFHVFGREALDDFNNQAENFVVYDVSPEAAAALHAAGSFEPFNLQARELWKLSRPLRLTGRRIHERLLHDDDPEAWDDVDPASHATLRRMRAILDRPFFRGFRVYVHPRGVQSLAYHFARLLDLNPRTPFRVELGNHNLHGEIYRRWLAQQAAVCEAR